MPGITSRDNVAEPTTIDEYIAAYPEVQDILQKARQVISERLPDAVERISWGMPTFYQGIGLIHFAANKKWLGIYPGAEAIEAFAGRFDEGKYKFSAGAVQLPYKPVSEMDWALVGDIAEFTLKHAR